MIKHWKTSLLGLLAIGGAIFHMHFTRLPSGPDWQDHVRYWGHDYMLLTVGIGLLLAKDHNK